MLELNKIYNMDCMEGMKRFPDKYFELAIVDPPYGSLSSINNRLNRKMFNNIEPPAKYYDELLRVSKNQIIWGANYLINFPFHGGGIVWNKLGTYPLHRKQAPTMGDAEYAYQSFANNIKMFSYGWMGNVTSNNYTINAKESKNRIHPTQKPVALYKWLLKNYAKEGDKILDTHMGSGSSVIACIDYGFEYIAFEIDKDYFEAALKRIEAEKMKNRLKLIPDKELIKIKKKIRRLL